MKKFKVDKKGVSAREIRIRVSSLVMAGVLFFTVAGMTGCSKKEAQDNTTITATQQVDEVDVTKKGILKLFPTMNQEIVDNSSIIIKLDELAPKDKNEKMNIDIISKYKSNIDADNMLADFNSFLDVLEQSMITGEKVIAINDLVIESDQEIVSKIEKITSNIINGDEATKLSNFDLIYTLFVEEDKVTYDGLEFEIRDLSYAGREIASVYARTSAYFARNYITEEEYTAIDDRTNNQNSKAYLKTDLMILDNQMDEKSEIDVITAFNNEYSETKDALSRGIILEEETNKNLVNYINLEYLDSDKVSTSDKNTILGEYEEEEVSDVLNAIDDITRYNLKNTDKLVLLSDMLIDEYKNTETGKVDKVALDYIQFNSLMLLKETTKESTAVEIFNNVYFQNLYLYMRKANFTHAYSADNKVDVNYQDISDGAKFVANKIVYYTLKERSNVFEYVGYEEKINLNLEESIQYVQNTITGECENVEAIEFVKTK